MNIVRLDAKHWQIADDFYTAVLRKLGAPDWHGKNINALIDSMVVGDINRLELPMRVIVTALDGASDAAFDELIAAFAALSRFGAVAHITRDRATLEIADSTSPFVANDIES